MAGQRHILISGVGNVLHQDDGFGIEVVRQLEQKNSLPDTVEIMETGIGGIHLVQELYNGYEVLILVDAVLRDKDAGHIYLLEAEVPDINEFSFDEKSDFLADMHFTNPSRALMLAKALNILPEKVYILGCQPAAYQDFDLGLSEEVFNAVPLAIERLESWVEQYYKDH
jgi:hydrogenase maturation protease